MSNDRRMVSLVGPNRRGELTREERAQLEWAINIPKGLHKKSVGRSIVLGADDRLLLLGPQEIPLGSTITIGTDAVMAVV